MKRVVVEEPPYIVYQCIVMLLLTMYQGLLKVAIIGLHAGFKKDGGGKQKQNYTSESIYCM